MGGVGVRAGNGIPDGIGEKQEEGGEKYLISFGTSKNSIQFVCCGI